MATKEINPQNLKKNYDVPFLRYSHGFCQAKYIVL
jgi:hypothetical protein